MKENIFEDVKLDHIDQLNITAQPFTLLKHVIETKCMDEDSEKLVFMVEEELTRRCELLGMNWELDDKELIIKK